MTDMAAVKTAISMEKDLFRRADKAAKELGISRGQLVCRAVSRFLSRRAEARITEHLNEVYGEYPLDDEDRSFLDAVLTDLAEKGHWEW
jgi:metal-responsive CopG/Arc/MetJ family transcriptional regulator